MEAARTVPATHGNNRAALAIGDTWNAGTVAPQTRQLTAAAELVRVLTDRGLFDPTPVPPTAPGQRPSVRLLTLLQGVWLDEVSDGHGNATRARRTDRASQLVDDLCVTHTLVHVPTASAEGPRQPLVALLRSCALWSSTQLAEREASRLPTAEQLTEALREATHVVPMGALMASAAASRVRRILLLYEWHESRHSQLGNVNNWALALCCLANGASAASAAQSAQVQCYGPGAAAQFMAALGLRYATFVMLPMVSATRVLEAQRRRLQTTDFDTADPALAYYDDEYSRESIGHFADSLVDRDAPA